MKVIWVVPGKRMRFEAEHEEELDVLCDLASGSLTASPLRAGGRTLEWRECGPSATAGLVLVTPPARRAWVYEWTALPDKGASTVGQAGQ